MCMMHYARNQSRQLITTNGDNPSVDNRLCLSIYAAEIGGFILTEKYDSVLLTQFMLSQLTFDPC